MRIEGLWGSPPPPVWPGSAQTALLFVGLPLLTAVVLLATPLHDAAPIPHEEPAPASAADLPAPEPRVAQRAGDAAAPPRALVRRQGMLQVPAVIYEVRRTVYRSDDRAIEAPMAAAAIRTQAAPARTERATVAAFVPQSP